MKKFKKKSVEITNHNNIIVRLDGGPFRNKTQSVNKYADSIVLTEYITDDSMNYEVVYHKYVKCDNCAFWHYESQSSEQVEVSLYRQQMLKKSCKSTCQGFACSYMWAHEGWHQYIENGSVKITWSDYGADIMEGVNRLV